MLLKGTLEILSELEESSKRFNELARMKGHSKPMNKHTLASRLKMMEKQGFVARIVKNTWPPHVTYAITDKGRDLLALMRQ